MTAPAGDSAKALLSGSIWMIAARWAMRLIGLVSTMVLARLLAPHDFGLVAMAMIAYGLFETISYASVDLALMRSQSGSREHFDTAWTIQILQGVFVAACVVAVAPFAARHFDDPRLMPLMLAVAPKALIEGLQNIGVVHFRKDLDFAKEFRFNLYNKLLGFVFVVAAAFWLRNYWALVVGHLVAAIVTVASSYAMHPYRPRWSLAKLADVWSFSQWLMVARFGAYLNRRADTFMVGSSAGAGAMGNYHLATELASLPSAELVMPIRRALFPTLAHVAEQRDAFARAAVDSFAAVSTLCLFVSAAMWVVAFEFTAVVLGPKWSEAAVLVRALAVYAAASSLVLVLEVPLWVAGRTNLAALQAWLELALLVPLIYVALQLGGAPEAAAARAGLAVAMVPVMMALAVRAGHIGWAALWGALWRPACAAVAAALITDALPWQWLPLPLLALIAKGAVVTAAFAIAALALWLASGRPPGFEANALAAAARLLPRRGLST